MAERKYQHVYAHEELQHWELAGCDQGDGNPSLGQMSSPIPSRSSRGAPRMLFGRAGLTLRDRWPETSRRKLGACLVRPLCERLGEVSLTGINSAVFPTLSEGRAVRAEGSLKLPAAFIHTQEPTPLLRLKAALGLHICLSHFYKVPCTLQLQFLCLWFLGLNLLWGFVLFFFFFS